MCQSDCMLVFTHTHCHTCRTVDSLQKANMSGFIHRQVSHDPQRKINLPKGTNFKNVLIKSCLYKKYPTSGPYAGGVVFKRCFGIGQGIGFTKIQCEKMWSDIKLSDHVQIVYGKSTDHTDTNGPVNVFPPDVMSHTYIHAYIHAYTHACIHAHTHICIHDTRIHAYMYIYMRTCIHVLHTYIHIHTYMRTCIHIYMRAHIHAYVYTCIYIHTSCVHVHAYMRTCVHTYTAVYMRAHKTYTDTYALTHRSWTWNYR